MSLGMLAYFLFPGINNRNTHFDSLTRGVLELWHFHVGFGAQSVASVGGVADHVRMVDWVIVHVCHASTGNFEVLRYQQRQAQVDAVEQVLFADELHVREIVLGEVFSVKNAGVVG